MNPIEAVRARLDGGRKWHKGNYGDGSGNVCLLGAFRGRYGVLDPALANAERTVGDIVREQFPERVSLLGPASVVDVPIFNDHPDTTWADVDLVLDKAAVRWDERA